MNLMTMAEITFIPTALMLTLVIAGLIFLTAVILYNLTNSIAVKIKYYLAFPFKYVNAKPQVSGFLKQINNSFHKIDLSNIEKFFIIFGNYIKMGTSRIFKLESFYFHNFLENAGDLISFIGLISRKIHDVNLKIYTAYLLIFIVLFYFIFRTM